MGKGGDFDKVADELLTRVGRKVAVVPRRRNKKKREEGEKKKKKKTTRRRNKMSAALVSCDAAAGNASAGTVYEQTARSAMCARFIPADRKRLSQWPIDG